MRLSHEYMNRRVWIASFSFLALIFFVWQEGAPLSNSSNASIRNRLGRVQLGVSDVMDVLQAMPSRYYIYDDDTISQARRVKHFRRKGELEVVMDHGTTDIQSERNMLEALKRHPLRTFKPQEAEIFIIPTPITEFLAYGCHWENCTWYDEAFDALVKNPTFQQHQGHNHVLIAQSWPTFNKRYSAYMPALSRNYRRLENVTVANDFDPFGCMELNSRLSKEPLHHDDFRTLYQEETPVTNAFSVGLGFHRPFPVRLASFEKFDASEFSIFYHPGEAGLSYGSTRYRELLLDENIVKSLSSSSFGHHIAKMDWVSGMTSSKFCLVVREHAPHSYTLSNAVRAGCIPVIISDDYQAYGGPFKSSISTKDFAIYIEEEALLANPLGELCKLQHHSEDLIKEKLKQLSIAQRILLPDHPRSLFVEAFVREAIASRANVLPQVAERLSIQILQGDGTVSGRCLQYHYPSTLATRRIYSKENELNVLVGVLSASGNFRARHSIRETWASDQKHNVFFLVAGPWDDSIKEEFVMYGDIFWIDMSEDQNHATYKLQSFLHAVDAHVDSAYDYVMMTNDASYVFLDDVKRHLSETRPDYWGLCRDPSDGLDHAIDRTRSDERAPSYASGIGYALSRDFVGCAINNLEAVRFQHQDDAATGILAEMCAVPCSSAGWNDRAFVYHGLTTSAEMVQKHWVALKNHKMAEWSLSS